MKRKYSSFRTYGERVHHKLSSLTTPCSMLVFRMFFVPSCSTSQCLRKIIEPQVIWCPHTDSNRKPTDYKSVALPIEL